MFWSSNIHLSIYLGSSESQKTLEQKFISLDPKAVTTH